MINYPKTQMGVYIFPTSGNVFTVNCYDSLAYVPLSGIFTNVPSDYYSSINNTKGALVATAYRTLLTDGWSYKFYRYDARGRVIRFWHYVYGLGWKSENYYYNSQNQVIRNWYQPNLTDGKVFTYTYDDAARLTKTNLYLGSQPEDPEEETDTPSAYMLLSKYTYNENSQVATHGLNIDQYVSIYSYNNRNWVSVLTNQGSNPVFAYGLTYNLNGNIRRQSVGGTYLQNLSDQTPLQLTYIYDQSNRLLKADKDSSSATTTFDLINNYDKDGNFVNMKRYGSANNLADEFNYNYFSGTNRLKRITGSIDQYAYDANGNMTKDDFNRNNNIKYDYRNLMTDIRTIRQESGFMGLEDKTYWTRYRYDEAGNRTRKIIYKYTGSEPDPIYEDGGDNPLWQFISDEFYVRDISGKEVAIYGGSSLTQWNIWGLDNVGKINADTTKYYYLKDHLGTIRVVLNSTNQVVSANDYDCWGYAMQNRNYQSTNTMYKFTGKERDNESSYDYFGARYYDSRIGRWGGEEPLLEKLISYSPYSYSVLNPLKYADVFGLGPKLTIEGHMIEIQFDIYYVTKESDATNGLDQDQITALATFKNDIEDEWSNNFDIFGENYIVSTTVNLVQQNARYSALETQVSDLTGYMLAVDASSYANIKSSLIEETGVGVSGNTIFMLSGSNLRPYISTGAHEAGHGMGLQHPAGNATDPNQPKKTSKSVANIMGQVLIKDGKEKRNRPSGKEFERIFKNNSINIKRNSSTYIDLNK